MAAFTFKHGDRPLEGFTIQRGVGRGGFGEVYFAVSDGGRELALKYLRDNPAIELRGVTHCMNLKSPHLVTIFDVKKNPQDEYFVIMEYVQGPSLRDLLIAEPNGLGVQKASFFLRELAKGLSYLHERGIVHRDMKPGNVFYEDGYVKIGDYGLSKFISVSRHSAQTASVGTVHYMAPEVGSGSYHRGIDIYALGVMLYEMLLGRVPYDGSSMGEVLMKHLTAQPEVDQLPAPFPEVIRKALAKDPKDRYQTVDEMAQDVLAAEHVQESLAGFNPVSLTAAARGAFDRAASPMPSPNPLPATIAYGPRHAAQGGRGGDHLDFDDLREIAPKLGRRVEQIGAKIERKLEKLDRKFGRKVPLPEAEAPAGEMKRRWFLGVLVLVGIAVAFGVVAGLSWDQEGAVASAIMGVLAMSGGVFAARKANRALGSAAQPRWVQGLVTLGCTAPLIAFSMAPAISDRFVPGMILGLIGAAIFVDWEKRMLHGACGEMKPGEAFTAGLAALIITAIFSSKHEKSMFLAAGVAAAASFAVQGSSWFIRPRGLGAAASDRQGRRKGPPPPPSSPARPVAGAAPGPVEVLRGEGLAGGAESGSSGGVGAFELGRRGRFGRHVSAQAFNVGRARVGDHEAIAADAEMNDPKAGLQRGVFIRAFWSLISFGLLAGVVIASLSAGLLRNMNLSDRHAALCAAVICFAFLTFALRKIRLYKQPTFWRNTLRPFLQTASLVGIGVPIVCLAVLRYVPEHRRAIRAETRVEASAKAWPEPPRDGASEDEVQAAEMRIDELDMRIARRERAAAMAMNDEEYVASISVLVLSSILYLILLFARGRTMPTEDFLMASPAAAMTTPGASEAAKVAG